MTSYEKNLNKNKFIFKLENSQITPLYNNQPKRLKIFSNIKSEKKGNFPDITPKYTKLNPVTQNIHTSQGINNLTEISKTYSLSKPKNENKSLSSKYKLSKITSNDLSTRINKSKISDIYNKKYDNSNSFKIETNVTFDNNKINILKTSNIINDSINGLRNLNIKNRTKENIYTNNDTYKNNTNLINDNSTNNSNSNLATKRETIGNLYLKTDINDIYINTPKDNNYKLDNFDKKLVIFKNNEIFGTPGGLLRKNNKILLANTTPENKIKISLDQNKQKIVDSSLKLKTRKNRNDDNNTNINSNNITTIKPSKNEHIILESINNSNANTKTIKNKITIDSIQFNQDSLIQKKKNKLNKCPEELHFYYITVLQEGKKNEIEFEGE